MTRVIFHVRGRDSSAVFDPNLPPGVFARIELDCPIPYQHRMFAQWMQQAQNSIINQLVAIDVVEISNHENKTKVDEAETVTDKNEESGNSSAT